MSKKNENVVMEDSTMIEQKHVLDVICDVNEGREPSLKAFALVLDIPATRLYAISKRPVVGAVYDPDAKNWDELNEFFVKKVTDPTAVITSMEELVKAAAEKDVWLTENAHVRTATGNNTIEVDGGMMPKRKAAMFEMGSEQESMICFKHDAQVYKIVYQTLGYTCVRPVNEDGSFAKEEVRVLSNGTLNTKCVPPTTMAQAIADRFSGAYANQTATEANKAEVESENANQIDIQ